MKTELQMQWSWKEISKHNYPGDAWVVLDDKVYDISTFINSHPGGATVLKPYLGKDISKSFRGEVQDGIKTALHKHDDSTVSLITTNFIGYIEGSEVTKSFTSPSSCINPEEPILEQLTNLGRKYYDVIDSPLHLHESARIFPRTKVGDVLESLSRTEWYVIPLTWVPIAIIACIYGKFYNMSSIDGEESYISNLQAFTIFCGGMLAWSILEYMLHRWLFHLEHWIEYEMFSSSWFIKTHFVMHGVHHLFPSDAKRLVMPPLNTCVIAVPITLFWLQLYILPVTSYFFAGALIGYISYDMTHYFLHFGGTRWEYLQSLRTHHMVHHYTNVDQGYGVSSKLWDYLLGDLGLKAGIPTAKLGRWEIIRTGSPTDENVLFKYHVAVAAAVIIGLPYLLNLYIVSINSISSSITL